jgi:hypothetical protein
LDRFRCTPEVIASARLGSTGYILEGDNALLTCDRDNCGELH